MERLVIVGCGYVGRAVAEEGLRRGMQVQALSRNEKKLQEIAELGVEVIEGQLQDRDWHTQIQPGADFVVDCVSSGGGGIEDYRRSYVEGMQSLIEWCQQDAPKCIAYTGSTSVYPQGGGAVVTEDCASPEAGDSAALLLESERLLLDAPLTSRKFVLRLSGIYGPGRHYLLDHLRRGTTVLAGSGQHHLNLVHRDDAVAALFRAYDSSHPGGVFNICDDAPARKKAVVEWLAEHLSVPAPEFDPETQGPRAARRGKGPMPDRIVSNARAKTELAWRPRYPSFRDGYHAILDSAESRA